MSRRKHYVYYDDHFKATAIALSYVKGVLAIDVADALCIHPVMLYRWRKELRDGKIVAKKKDIKLDPEERTELKRLRKLEKQHKVLQQEHELLKKAIQFSLEKKGKSSSL